MRLEEILTDRAQSTPERIALASGRTKLIYGELDAMSDRLASAFAGRGVGRTDRICVFMEDWCAAALATFAAVKAGAAASPVHLSATAEALAFNLGESRARAIVTEARLAGLAAQALRHVDSVTLVVLAGGGQGAAANGCLRFEDAIATTTAATPVRGDDSDEALWISPARPAGLAPGFAVVHRDFAAALPTAPTSGGEEETLVTALPLASEAGLRELFTAVKYGITLVRTGASASDRRPIRYLPEAPRTLRSSLVR